MSYLILARKWRPQRFSEVVGQDHVTRTLQKAAEKGRLAHAYLFAGPRGCGKTTTARLLAKVINCEGPEESEPCNKCSSCKAVMEGRHLDSIEIDGASNRGIDEIRDLREKIGYAPSQSKAKIYIIDEVHMLTPQAFNALLKTLEEPPAHVYLVFATTQPHKVPATILSRCQRFNFKRLELSELTGQLEKICSQERIECEHEALVLISRRAEGSMRDAESLLDQCISAADRAVDIGLVRRVLGLVDSQLVNDLLACLAGRDRGGVLTIVDRVVSSGSDIEEFFLAYIEGLRNLLVLSIGEGASHDWLDLTEAEIEEQKRIAEAFRTEDLLYLFRAASIAFRELKGSHQPRYHLEAALTEAASWDSAVELSKLLRALESIDNKGITGGRGRTSTATGGSPPSNDTGDGSASSHARRPSRGGGNAERSGGSSARAEAHAGGADQQAIAVEVGADESPHGHGASPFPPAGPQPSRVEPVVREAAPVGMEPTVAGEMCSSTESLRELGGRGEWERFLAQVREAKLTLGIWLMSAEVKGIRGDRLILAFSPQNRFAREMIREERNRRYIESHMERFFGRRLIIETDESVKETPREKEEVVKDRPKPDPRLEKLAGDAPMVKRLIEEFDGVLVGKDQRSRRIVE
ncbi:MAG: DNA polymerase III subunit gamma/tau [bacterium]|nr:MAG: DNA polymerase III subunit gamma/tau [bacterium]